MYIIDTSVLMILRDFEELLTIFSDVRVPYEVLCELDGLKVLEGNRGYCARRAIKNIEKNLDKIDCLFSNRQGLSRSNDDCIINYLFNFEAILLTNDISMSLKTKSLGKECRSFYPTNKIINGCVEIGENDLDFPPNETDENIICEKLIDGQYLISNDKENAFRFVKTEGLQHLKMNTIGNFLFKIRALDIYQHCAIDSLYRDEMTLITGHAGTGKTLLSLAYCLQKIKNGATVHIFCNPVKTRGSADLGSYPGSRDEKLLQNFIGALLVNKVGSVTEVEKLIDDGSLMLHPFSDIRGIEIGQGDILYITEAQNLSIDMIKLAIQRCEKGAKIIIEGDPDTQVDSYLFENEKNGLKRVIEVFTGVPKSGFVNLPNIYRSDFAKIAELL